MRAPDSLCKRHGEYKYLHLLCGKTCKDPTQYWRHKVRPSSRTQQKVEGSHFLFLNSICLESEIRSYFTKSMCSSSIGDEYEK